MTAPQPATPSPNPSLGFLARIVQRWQGIPLYGRILGAVGFGTIVGLLLGPNAGFLDFPSKLVLRLLGALAAPLILLAVVETLMHAKIPPAKGARLIFLLVTNTLVAIFIGLLVANTLRPGEWTRVEKPTESAAKGSQGPNPWLQFFDNVPKSILGPLAEEGKVIGVIMLAVAFGIALRRLKEEKISTVQELVSVGFRTMIILLHWLIEVIPFAVFGIVASIVGVKGFSEFRALGVFVLAVLAALLLQCAYYLTRIRLGSWVRPMDVVRDMRDALVMAFSTASSTATMPVTYSCLRTKVGVREQSASMGALIGANFNNDGTALYEAMAALFISQMLGLPLTMEAQLMLVLTSVIASVGAAGIPEAGLVTMTLVFNAVKLPTEYIPVLLTVDWFLDRCRTAINVMGDVTVSCLLDGRSREVVATVPEPELVQLTH